MVAPSLMLVKALDNSNQAAAIAGAIAGAKHVHTMSKAYGVPVILHTDHCAKKLLPWLDGLITASEEFIKKKVILYLVLT